MHLQKRQDLMKFKISEIKKYAPVKYIMKEVK